MSGEMNLDRLLASMEPSLAPETFVFCTVSPERTLEGLSPRMTFEEAEGRTLILVQYEAKAAGIDGEFPCRMITLNVHSALEAVGFLAVIVPALAARGMGVNPVAGFFHDHLFIPADKAEDAMECLHQLVAERR